MSGAAQDLHLFDWPPRDPALTVAPAHRTTRSRADRQTPAVGVQQLVAEFHERFDLPRSTRPTIDVEPALAELRNALLREEALELMDACAEGDLVAIADGLADVLYVVYGTAVTYGLDADALVREVHRSNMSKLGCDGQPIRREDGKVLKGPHYTPPQFGAELALARGAR